jgi:hypothetical protein
MDLTYHYANNNGHYGGSLEGPDVLQSVDRDHVQTHTMQFGAEYVTPIKGLSVAASAFLMKPNFVGDVNYLPHGTLHGCTGEPPNVTCTHAETDPKFTDFLGDVRYQLPISPADFAITPVAGVTIPITDYPVVGHSGYGKGLNEFRIGLDVGRTFAPLIDNMYFDVLYTYSFIEDVTATPEAAEYGNNRSDARAILGYFILPNLSVFGGMLWRYVHGGFSWGDLQEPVRKKMAGEMLTPLDVTMLTLHDQLGQERAYAPFGGISYSPFESFAIQASVLKIVKGDSVPATFAASLGVAWTAF